jgi:hypothetical protein
MQAPKRMGDGDGSHVDETSTKYLFCDSTWKEEHVTYDPEPMEFTRVHGNNFFGIHFQPYYSCLKFFGPITFYGIS